ncbi:hypothetical protein EIP86_009158 [Pleurotus ostreatoroseus]|nr:hypothetical protein EIP86_009158 [Pleurotus ostreatoroseus]
MASSAKSGPPANLISRIQYLEKLLQHLPTDLPQEPGESTYHFGLDEEDIKEEGYWYALNRNLEVSFGTHKLRGECLRFTERGARLSNLIKMFKHAVKMLSPSERDFFREHWLERLISAAFDSGAKLPVRKRPTVETSEDESQPTLRTAVVKKKRRAHREPSVVDLTSEADGPVPSHEEISQVRAPDDLPELVEVDESDDEFEDKTKSSDNAKHVTSTNTSSTTATPLPTLSMESMEQGKLARWGFGVKLTPQQAAAQKSRQKEKEKADAERRKKEAEVRERREAAAKAEKAARKRELARLRQRKCRASKVAKEVRSGKRNSAGKIMKMAVLGYDRSSTTPILNDLATLSRPGMSWKKWRNGKRLGAVQGKHTRVNWFHPYLWSMIDDIAPRVGWSSRAIVSHLQRSAPRLFNGLHRGTVWKWMSKTKKGWSKRTLDNVARRSALARSGHKGILTAYPGIVDIITGTLKDLRVSGVAVNVTITRAIMLAIIREKNPELLTNFKCSEVRTFRDNTVSYGYISEPSTRLNKLFRAFRRVQSPSDAFRRFRPQTVSKV